jgi:fucose 4-O-acetylase-like acetyltransferase
LSLTRVIAWHTWAWTPLSWFAAIPAMFFTAGALLTPSLNRYGYLATLSNRLRRLMLPYLAYSVVAVVVMLVMAWRPPASISTVAWLVPVVDPVGSSDAPGLWVPLWYLRAYLWFLIASGLFATAARRLGWGLP